MTRHHPKSIDRYKIRGVLGEGAMGSVYAAWDPKLQREVAIKLVPEHVVVKGKGRERFDREARALAAIAHPNIVEIYDYSGQDAEALYVVIEKLDGEDLYAAMHRKGKMHEAIAAAIGHDLCSALEAAHAAGLIHRDIKPENVFLNQNGRVVLTDFGIVKAVRRDTTVRGYRDKTEVIGTPGFMAPEQMRSRGLGPSTDIYALGALLYNIVTKRMPFEGSSPLAIFHAAQQGHFDDPRNYSPGLSEGFCAIIRNCLQPLPSRRPASAADVRAALKEVLDDAGVTDVRDELRQYIQNPEAARRRALTRTIAVQADKLKIATLDHDSVAMQKARTRLLNLDPTHKTLLDAGRGSGSVFGLGTHRMRLRIWWHRSHWQMRAQMRSWRAALRRRQHEVSLPVAVFVSCLCVAVSSLSLGLYLGPKNPGASRAVSAAPYTPSRQALGASVLNIGEVTTGMPASLRAPHPMLDVSPLYTAPKPRPALLDLTIGKGLHLVLDGQRLTHRSYMHLALTPGRHTVDYINASGRRVRRVLMMTSSERIKMRVDRYRPAALRRQS